MTTRSFWSVLVALAFQSYPTHAVQGVQALHPGVVRESWMDLEKMAGDLPMSLKNDQSPQIESLFHARMDLEPLIQELKEQGVDFNSPRAVVLEVQLLRAYSEMRRQKTEIGVKRQVREGIRSLRKAHSSEDALRALAVVLAGLTLAHQQAHRDVEHPIVTWDWRKAAHHAEILFLMTSIFSAAGFAVSMVGYSLDEQELSQLVAEGVAYVLGPSVLHGSLEYYQNKHGEKAAYRRALAKAIRKRGAIEKEMSTAVHKACALLLVPSS